MTVQGLPYGNNRGYFVVRFMVSHTEKAALHFAVRFDQSVVIRSNSHNDKAQLVIFFKKLFYFFIFEYNYFPGS